MQEHIRTAKAEPPSINDSAFQDGRPQLDRQQLLIQVSCSPPLCPTQMFQAECDTVALQLETQINRVMDMSNGCDNLDALRHFSAVLESCETESSVRAALMSMRKPEPVPHLTVPSPQTHRSTPPPPVIVVATNRVRAQCARIAHSMCVLSESITTHFATWHSQGSRRRESRSC
jgi:hypothetical protein